MDVLKWIAILIHYVLRALLKLSWLLVFGFFLLLWRGFCRMIGKKPSRLKSGERVIRYADGKEFIVLEAKDAPPRRVLNTPAMRARLLEEKRRKSLLRFLRR